MSNTRKKFSDLPAASTTLDGTEIVPIYQGSTTARTTLAQVRPGIFYCENYGASAAATGATNTAAIQAALNAASSAGGGWVQLNTPGTYTIAPGTDATALANFCCLYIDSNTRLTLGTGVVVKLLGTAGVGTTGAHMLTNKNWTAGNTGIIVEGGVWDQDNNGGGSNATRHPLTSTATPSPTTCWYGHGLVFVKVSGLVVRDFSVLNTAMYAVEISGCPRFVADNIYVDSYRDGIHVDGPSDRFTLQNCRGSDGDDLFPMTVGNYVGNEWTYGDITDGVIFNCHNLCAGVAGGTKPFTALLGAAAKGKFENITFRNCSHKSTGASKFIRLEDDCADSQGNLLVGATMTNISLENCYAYQGGVNITSSGLKDLTLKNCIFEGNNAISTAINIAGDTNQTSGVNVGMSLLEISSGCKFWNTPVLILNGKTNHTVTIDRIKVSGVDIADANLAGWAVFLLGVTSTSQANTVCPLVEMQNVTYVSGSRTGGGILVIMGGQTGATLVQAQNVRIQDCGAFAYDYRAPLTISAANVHCLNTNYSLYSPVGPITVLGGPWTDSRMTKMNTVVSGTGTISVNGPTLPIDTTSAAAYLPAGTADGATAYNIGGGTLGNGPVVQVSGVWAKWGR